MKLTHLVLGLALTAPLGAHAEDRIVPNKAKPMEAPVKGGAELVDIVRFAITGACGELPTFSVDVRSHGRSLTRKKERVQVHLSEAGYGAVDVFPVSTATFGPVTTDDSWGVPRIQCGTSAHQCWYAWLTSDGKTPASIISPERAQVCGTNVPGRVVQLEYKK